MSVLEQFIGILAPPDCINCGNEGATLCSDCRIKTILPFGERCWRCNRLSPAAKTCPSCRSAAGPSYCWITTNYEKTARDVVVKYKFNQQRVAAMSISKMMGASFWKYNSAESVASRNYVIVHVPTATSRVRERGFDHAGLLAKEISKNLKMERADALNRLGQIRQLGSKRQDRLLQLSDSFVVKLPGRIAGRNVLLIDDVLTTGGTIIAASKALKAAGAKQLDALVFAKRL